MTKPTRLVRTGGGGAHLYFKWPAVESSQSKFSDHVDVRSSGGTCGFSDHVDVRSSGGTCGGFVLGEGSITTKGPYTLEEDEPLPTPPCG